MITLHSILIFLHGLNRWLALLSGVWALGQVLPGLTGKRVFGLLERRSIGLFGGLLYLQMILGLLLVAEMSLQHSPIFAGRTATQWGHMLGGFLAVAAGTLALLSARKTGGQRAKYLFTGLWSALALLLLGRLQIMLALLALLLLAQAGFLWLRQRAEGGSKNG